MSRSNMFEGARARAAARRRHGAANAAADACISQPRHLLAGLCRAAGAPRWRAFSPHALTHALLAPRAHAQAPCSTRSLLTSASAAAAA
jgi:hypothetical protein